MTRTRFPEVALVAALATLGFAAQAQPTGTQSGTAQKSDAKAATKPDGKSDAKSGSLSGDDRTFVMKAAQGGLMEVEAGKVAQSKAQNAEVKQYAQRMVADHSKANDELMALAKSKNVDVPSALDKSHQAHLDKLNKASGAAFDREYMKHMVDDHRKTVADFEKQSKNGKDADLKKWADSKLPTLREHLKLAQATHGQVAQGGGKGGDHKHDAKGSSTGPGDAKTGGKSDQTKPVNTANPAGNTTGSSTGNTAGAAPKPATTGSGK